MLTEIPDPQFFEDLSVQSCSYYLQNASGNLYFISIGGVGNPPITDWGLYIWKSTDNGATWVKVMEDYDRGTSRGLGVCILNDVIYIGAQNPNGLSYGSNIYLFRYDTNTDSFLTDSVGPSGNTISYPVILCPWGDGSIFICAQWKIFKWDNGWSSSYGNVGWDPVWAIKEHNSEIIHLIGQDNYKLCQSSIAYPGTMYEHQFIGDDTEIVESGLDIGMPSIRGYDTQIIVPYRNSLDYSLHVSRGTMGLTPTWVVETPEIPEGIFTTFTSWNWYVVSSLYSKGKIYIFFPIQNEEDTSVSPTFQSWLYEIHTDELTGGWTTPEIIFTADIGQAIASNYPIQMDNGFGIVTAAFDIALWSNPGGTTKYSSLNLWFIGTENPINTATAEMIGESTFIAEDFIEALVIKNTNLAFIGESIFNLYFRAIPECLENEANITYYRSYLGELTQQTLMSPPTQQVSPCEESPENLLYYRGYLGRV